MHADYYGAMMPRLNGAEIGKRFPHYRSLVRKGVAGFIVFGGRLETVRKHLAFLQEEAALPLVIGSDLERGLGQQLGGGTLFPPAMAVSSAAKNAASRGRGFDLPLFRRYCRAVAEEAAYAGINAIFAPVLDVNTNPANPIIAARAFGEDAETVSLLGAEMVRVFEKAGIASCGKHFPGHGDTRVDSHIRLPSIGKSLAELRRVELVPFNAAVAAGVSMIMLGHLRVPAIDPSGIPASLSCRAVQMLRRRMGFQGLLITDALNMSGIGRFSEEEAALRSLSCGVDIMLHPSDTDRVCAYLSLKAVRFDNRRLVSFRKRLARLRRRTAPDFSSNRELASEITGYSVTATGTVATARPLFILIITDDPGERGAAFAARLKRYAQVAGAKTVRAAGDVPVPDEIPEGCMAVAAVFSETRAWKGGPGGWIASALSVLRERPGIAVSFGSPYLLNSLPKSVPRIVAYADSPRAETLAADMIAGRAGH